MKYPVYEPLVRPYTKSILKAINDGWVSSQGEFIQKTTNLLKNILNTPYLILTNNGTSSTHLLYLSLKYKYPNLTRIYVPNYVFAAVWNCALYEYDSTSISVLDTNAETMNMRVDDEYILSLEKGSAIVIVHNIANVVDVPRLKALRPDIIFVEDNCEAFLEKYGDKYTGTESLCAALSFFGNKIITSGEGGAFYTNDRELYEYIYKTCHHGMTHDRYIYDVLGRNYRMTNLQAALLYDQLLDIQNILELKVNVYNNYCSLFKNTPVEVKTTGKWMFVIQIPNMKYKDFYDYMMSNGIDTRPMFYHIHSHNHLRIIDCNSYIENQHEIAIIPSSPTLTYDDQVYIAEKILEFISTL